MKAKPEYLIQQPVKSVKKKRGGGGYVVEFENGQITVTNGEDELPDLKGRALLDVTYDGDEPTTLHFGIVRMVNGVAEISEALEIELGDTTVKVDHPMLVPKNDQVDPSIPPHPDERIAVGPLPIEEEE